MPVVLERFSAAQEQQMHAFIAQWTALTREHPADREATRAAIEAIYDDLNLPRPEIIWCRSIPELIVLHGLIALFKFGEGSGHGSPFDVLSKQELEPWWRAVLSRAKEELESKASVFEIDRQQRSAMSGFDGLYGKRRTRAAGSRRAAVILSLGSVLEKLFGVPVQLAVRKHFNHFNENFRDRALIDDGVVDRLRLSRRGFLFSARPGALFAQQLDDAARQLVLTAIDKIPGNKNESLPDFASVFAAMQGPRASSNDSFGNELDYEALFPLNSEQINLGAPSDGTPACVFLLENFNVDVDPKLRRLMQSWDALKRNVIDFEFFDKLCFVADYPTSVKFDARGRLHSDSGAAMSFRDSFEVHCIEGVRVRSGIVLSEVKLEDIDKEENVERRRILIRQYGIERYITDSGAQIIHRDQFGTLYKKSMPHDEPLVVVRVKNPTAEPDGSNKEYFLRVPPYMSSAKAAVAWTFGLSPEEYELANES